MCFVSIIRQSVLKLNNVYRTGLLTVFSTPSRSFGTLANFLEVPTTREHQLPVKVWMLRSAKTQNSAYILNALIVCILLMIAHAGSSINRQSNSTKDDRIYFNSTLNIMNNKTGGGAGGLDFHKFIKSCISYNKEVVFMV